MSDWTEESAQTRLGELIETAKSLARASRTSEEWTCWRMNTLSFLEEVFGKSSRAFKSFAAIPWAHRATIAIDTEELLMDNLGRVEGVNDFLERKNQEAAWQQLGMARGILSSALEDLKRKGLRGAFVSVVRGVEASELLKMIRLIERQWRKAIFKVPENEKQVQDALETLLIGAEIPYAREQVAIPYGTKTYKPDFTVADLDLAIEVKLVAAGGREKELHDEINADIIAYRTQYKNVLFAIYDNGFIRDVDRFSGDFEKEAGVIVRIVKN